MPFKAPEEGRLILFGKDSLRTMVIKARHSPLPKATRSKRKFKATASFYAGDTETAYYPGNTQRHIWLWSLYCGDPVHEMHGTSCEDLIKAIVSLDANVVYFHNLKYDASYILSWILEHDPLRLADEFITDDDVEYALYLYRDNGELVVLRDSFKKYATTIKKMGDIFGIPKQEIEVKDRVLSDDYEPTQDEIDYCIRDATIAWTGIKRMHDAGRLALTASGDARRLMYDALANFAIHAGLVHNPYYKAYRKVWPLANIGTQEMFEFCYNGGWVIFNPAYHKQWVRVQSYDVNSHYPAIMRDALPYGGIGRNGMPIIRKDPGDCPWYMVIFEAKFKPRDPNLKWIKTVRIRQQQYYAGDEWYSSSYNDFTLKYEYVKLGMIKEEFEDFKKHYIYDIRDARYICFYHTDNYLRELVDQLGTEKIEASKNMKKYAKGTSEYSAEATKKELTKITLNSLYGACGMKILRGHAKHELDDKGVLRYGSKGWDFIEGVYMPVACYITAMGRLKVQKMWWEHPDQMVYTDTDSCKTRLSFEWPSDQIDDVEFGKFKPEYGSGRDLYVMGMKQYVTRDGDDLDVRLAGVPDEGKEYIKDYLRNNNYQLPDQMIIPHCKRQKRVPGGIDIVEIEKNVDFTKSAARVRF